MRVEQWEMSGYPGAIISIEDDTEERRVTILHQTDTEDGWGLGASFMEPECEWEWFLDFAGIPECSCKYQQHIISQVLRCNDVEVIVELGTFKGALALYLGVCGLVKGIPVYTFDRDTDLSIPAQPAMNRMEVIWQQTDYLTDAGIADVMCAIANRRVYLICDGDNANKATEFNTFVPLLKKGSVVSVHDWHAEVHPEDIKETVERYNMRFFGERDWFRHHTMFATFVKET